MNEWCVDTSAAVEAVGACTRHHRRRLHSDSVKNVDKEQSNHCTDCVQRLLVACKLSRKGTLLL